MKRKGGSKIYCLFQIQKTKNRINVLGRIECLCTCIYRVQGLYYIILYCCIVKCDDQIKVSFKVFKKHIQII